MSVSPTARIAGVATDADNRERDDFYPTNPIATRALLDRVEFHGSIWEPACGDGAISDVLKEYGYAVESTDLINRGYGTPRVDFLMEYRLLGDNIITNPPFKYATEFAQKALDLRPAKVAMLFKLQFLESIGRRDLFRAHPPKKIWIFSERLPMQRGRQATDDDTKGMMCFIWILWERDWDRHTEIGWI